MQRFDFAANTANVALRNEGPVLKQPVSLNTNSRDSQMREHSYYVYITTNRRGTLYTGITNDVDKRMHQHRKGESQFTSGYRIGKLIYVEVTNDVYAAIAREKQIKGWTRAKKLALIRTLNPSFRDLTSAAYYWRHIVQAHRLKGDEAERMIAGVPADLRDLV